MGIEIEVPTSRVSKYSAAVKEGPFCSGKNSKGGSAGKEEEIKIVHPIAKEDDVVPTDAPSQQVKQEKRATENKHNPKESAETEKPDDQSKVGIECKSRRSLRQYKQTDRLTVTSWKNKKKNVVRIVQQLENSANINNLSANDDNSAEEAAEPPPSLELASIVKEVSDPKENVENSI